MNPVWFRIQEAKCTVLSWTTVQYVCQVWDVGLCVDKLQSKVRKKRELRLGIGPDEPAPDSAYASLLFREDTVTCYL